jgi:hypothetical protein
VRRLLAGDDGAGPDNLTSFEIQIPRQLPADVKQETLVEQATKVNSSMNSLFIIQLVAQYFMKKMLD